MRVGQREVAATGHGYMKDPLYPMMKEYLETVNNILETDGMDVFTESNKIASLPNKRGYDMLKEFYINNSFDVNEYAGDEFALQEKYDDMEAYFFNEMSAIKENALSASTNAVMGLMLPMHKNFLMSNIYESVIQNVVAESPKLTITMEKRVLYDVDGNKYDLFKDQLKIKEIMDGSLLTETVSLTLPETGSTDLITEAGGTTMDSMDISTRLVSYTALNMTDSVAIDFATNMAYTSTGSRINTQEYEVEYKAAADDTETTTGTDILFFTMAKDGKSVTVSSLNGLIASVEIEVNLDNSNAMHSAPSVGWEQDTDTVEIGTSPYINTTISPEVVKDVSKLYQVDYLTKIVANTKEVLANYKNDTISQKLYDSFLTMDEDNKQWKQISLKQTDGYMADPFTWRQAIFMRSLDIIATDMLNILNDPNMTISVVGHPTSIAAVMPQDPVYSSPSNIGPVTLDYRRSVFMSTGQHLYNFVSDQKKDKQDLMIILNPRNTNRIIYRIYNYQLYATDETRNIQNPALKAFHAFERWAFKAYQPVQSRIRLTEIDGGLTTDVTE